MRLGEDAPFNCATCSDVDKQKRNCRNVKGLELTAIVWDEYDTDRKNEMAKQLTEAGAAKIVGLGDIRLYECPLSWITPETYEVMKFINFSRDSGALYAAGGWDNQPAWFVRAYEIVRTEIMQWEKKRKSKQ